MPERVPIVSVIMASYNHAASIRAAVESVQRQDYDAWELLIADDASTDGTRDVLATLAEDARIRIFPFDINREYHMRNYAAAHARGDYIAFLNSDDVFLPEKLGKQVDVLERNPQVAAVFTHTICIDDHDRRLTGHVLEKLFAVENQSSPRWLRHFFLSGNCLCISSAMVRRECFREVGGFNPLLVQISDLDLWIRLCLKWEMHVIPEPLTKMRIHANSRNLSAASPAADSRLLLERQQVYAHYFGPDGLGRMPTAFPELAALLPEDTPLWRCYLLCRMATTLPSKSMRLLGFSRLHELLKGEGVRTSLLGRNRRLLRTLFLSEGAASLDRDGRGMFWTVRFDSKKPELPGVCTRWTAAHRGVTCFSVPNPGIACRLWLGIETRSVPLRCRRFRLYDPQTGNLVLDAQGTPCLTAGPSRKTGAGRSRQGDQDSPPETGSGGYLPEIDFTAYSSKEIDIEADVELRYTWKRLLTLVPRGIRKLCAAVRTCVRDK